MSQIKSPFGTVIIDPDDPSHPSPLQTLFEHKESEKTHRHQSIDMTPPADIYEDGSSFSIWIDLPGVDKDSINVSMTGQVLVVDAQTQKLNLEGGFWVRHERPVGSYIRRLQLNHEVDPKSISANYADGTLKLTITKPEHQERKSIDVKMD